MTAKSDDPAAGFIAAVRPEQGILLEQLRAIVVKNVPGATVTIKWGVPFYELGGKKICALAAFKEHVGINIFAPPELLVDPAGKLEGEGKSNRMLKVRSKADIDTKSIQRWLKAAVAAAR